MTCLNCGASLADRFCAMCGQRVVPPYPTMREMMGDAWDEMVGYDGRFLRTIRLLLLHPGHLTNEVLQGRRARYIFPVRLYLFASFAYFLATALAPPMGSYAGGIKMTSDDVVIRLDEKPRTLTPEQRAQLLAQVDEAPAVVQPLIRAVAADPEGFTRSLLENMPRVLFALVPFFAAIMKLFHRGGWVQHMTFSLHLHAGLFLLLIARELSKFSGNLIVLGVVETITLVVSLGYILLATRTVYAERWSRVLLKFVPIFMLYSLGYGLAAVVAIAWTAGW